MRNLSAARRLGVGERRERRDEDGRRGGGRAVRAVALVVVVARVVVAAAGRVVVVELRAELRAAAGARRRERARVRRVAPGSSHDTRLPSPRPATLPVWMRRTCSIVVGGKSLAHKASRAPRSGVSSSAETTVASASRRSISVATSSRARTLCFAMRFVRITAWIEPRSLRRGLNTEGLVSAGATLTNFTLHCTGLNILVGERTPRKAWSPTSVG